MSRRSSASTAPASDSIRIVNSTRAISASPQSPQVATPRRVAVSGSGGSSDGAGGWWGAVQSTVKFLSNLAIDDEDDDSEHKQRDRRKSSPTPTALTLTPSLPSPFDARALPFATLYTPHRAAESDDEANDALPVTTPRSNRSVHRRASSDQVTPSRTLSDTSTISRSDSSGARDDAIETARLKRSVTSSPSSASFSLPTSPAAPQRSPSSSRGRIRFQHFQRLLSKETLDIEALRSLAWTGVPLKVRAQVWRLLLGYLPLARNRRDSLLAKRRAEYVQFLRTDYLTIGRLDSMTLEDGHRDILAQIKQDVPRTSPALPFFKQPAIQASLTRVLYMFSIRHPASGYVQGFNDLLTPFYAVFYTELTTDDADTGSASDADSDPGSLALPRECQLDESKLLALEADSFWCLSAFIDRIQDHYIFAQPGIQRSIFQLQSLTTVLAPQLVEHFDREGVQFLHFAFRWMNCLLMREIALPCTVRLFDTYLSVSPVSNGGFGAFHVYVCAAFLLYFAPKLLTLEFQDLILFLQKLPTDDWSAKEMESLIAQAFVYQNYDQQQQPTGSATPLATVRVTVRPST